MTSVSLTDMTASLPTSLPTTIRPISPSAMRHNQLSQHRTNLRQQALENNPQSPSTATVPSTHSTAQCSDRPAANRPVFKLTMLLRQPSLPPSFRNRAEYAQMFVVNLHRHPLEAEGVSTSLTVFYPGCHGRVRHYLAGVCQCHRFLPGGDAR